MTSDKIDDAAKSYLNEAVSEQQKILQKYRIALEVMERYPLCLQEFKERITSIW